MEKHLENESLLLCGRWFTKEELEDIKYIVQMFAHLTRNELAKTICEGLSWVTHKGEYKINSGLELMEKLEAKEWIVLPEKRNTGLRPSEQVTVGEQTNSETEIQNSVSNLAPIELQAARSKEDMRLWNEYVERYHILGYKRPFGAHQRYFIWSNTPERKRILGCMLFSASAWALAERDTWIGWSKEDRSQRLHLIVNNTRYPNKNKIQTFQNEAA